MKIVIFGNTGGIGSSIQKQMVSGHGEMTFVVLQQFGKVNFVESQL